MYTTSHGIIGYLLFKKEEKRIIKYAVIGAILPDITMIMAVIFYMLVGMFVGGESYDAIHQAMHQSWFGNELASMGHSIFFWLGILFVALILKNKFIRVFFYGGLSHVVIDFLTHQGRWAWNHLYPLNVAAVQGPVDYTDTWFFLTVHSIWAFMFLPKAWGYLQSRRAKSAEAAVES